MCCFSITCALRTFAEHFRIQLVVVIRLETLRELSHLGLSFVSRKLLRCLTGFRLSRMHLILAAFREQQVLSHASKPLAMAAVGLIHGNEVCNAEMRATFNQHACRTSHATKTPSKSSPLEQPMDLATHSTRVKSHLQVLSAALNFCTLRKRAVTLCRMADVAVRRCPSSSILGEGCASRHVLCWR